LFIAVVVLADVVVLVVVVLAIVVLAVVVRTVFLAVLILFVFSPYSVYTRPGTAPLRVWPMTGQMLAYGNMVSCIGILIPYPTQP